MTSASHQYVGQRSLVKLKKYLYMVKLDRSNFFAWKVQVVTHLRGNGWLRFIKTDIDEDGDLAVQQDQLLLGEAMLLTSAQIEAAFVKGVKKRELTAGDEDVEVAAEADAAVVESATIIEADEEVGDSRRGTRSVRPTQLNRNQDPTFVYY